MFAMPKNNAKKQKAKAGQNKAKNNARPQSVQNVSQSVRKVRSKVAVPAPVSHTPRKRVMSVPKSQSIITESAAPSSGGGFFSNLGSTVGSVFGSEGRDIGRGLGSLLGRITGMGDYKISHNTLMSGPPLFKDDGSTVISHREYVQDIKGSIAFSLTEFALNPGSGNTFPWLARMASLYDQYQMLGLVIEYKSTSSDSTATTNTALGSVIMTTSYDPLDPNFSSKQQMEAYEYTTSCKPSANMLHAVECAPKNNTLKNLYVRTTTTPSGADKHFYDLGTFYVATTGMQADGNTIGEIWVSYHVKLMRPKLPTPIDELLLSAHFYGFPSSSYGPLCYSSGVPMEAAIDNTLSVDWYVGLVATQRVVFDIPGTYALYYWADWSAGTVASLPSDPVPYGSAVMIHKKVQSNLTAKYWNVFYVVSVVNPGDGVTFSNCGATTGSQLAELYITQWSSRQVLAPEPIDEKTESKWSLRRPSYELVEKPQRILDDGETDDPVNEDPAANFKMPVQLARAPSHRSVRGVNRL